MRRVVLQLAAAACSGGGGGETTTTPKGAAVVLWMRRDEDRENARTVDERNVMISVPFNSIFFLLINQTTK
jgi:hypothetical protein